MTNQNYHILLVEDTKIASMVAIAVLKGIGCTVDLAETADEAINLFTLNDYDLVFMDIGLPGNKDGIAATKEIKLILNKNQIPIVALTAHNDDELRERCMQAGMADFLTKPLTTEKINAIFNSYLAES
jgi:CheY-like chemotaxis protein